MTRHRLALADKPHRRALRASASTVGALLVLAAGVVPAMAHGPTEYTGWGAPTAVTEVNTAAHDGCPIESPDGRKLYVASTRAGGFGEERHLGRRAPEQAVDMGADDEPRLRDQHRGP